MTVFSIYDGRMSFWQWDLNQKIVVADDVCCEVHFCNGTTESALVCEVFEQDGKRLVNVPNVLLQTSKPLKVFAYAQSESGERTIHSEIFRVNEREKPDDYIYTETEVWKAERAVEKALQEAKDSGEFKGDPGPKGDPGVVKFVVVNELPETDTENAIYLVPATDGAEDNLFDEYIFVDGKWEKIGSAAVAVDMTGYVKDTDYAAQHKAGVVKVWHNYHGLKISPEGILTVAQATEDEIDKKTDFRILSAKNLDYAIKKGLADNKEEWTEEEQKAARDLVGAVGNTDMAMAGGAAGLVKISTLHYGLQFVSINQCLRIQKPTAAQIEDRSGYDHIAVTLGTFDKILKNSLTTNTEILTDEEKAAAQAWLGVTEQIGNIETALDGIIAIQNELIGGAGA